MDWYRKSVDETARALGTEAAVGLTGVEAAARLEKHGPNALKQAKKRALWQMYLAQLKDVMVLVLLAAALISGVLLGEWVDAGIILLVVLLNALLGVIQENRAEKSLEALKKLSSPHAKVRRDGEISSVPAADLVPGDVVLLEAGDYVSADLRLTVSAGLRVDESALTGESEPVEKHAETLPQEGDLPLGDRTNLAFSGSLVTYGRGEGIVVATGDGHAAGRYRRHAGRRGGRGDAPAASHGRPGQKAGAAVHWGMRAGLCGRGGLRKRCGRDVYDGHQPGRGGHTRGAAGHCDHRAGHRRAADDRAERHHPPPAGCGSPGQRHGDLLG